MPRQKIELASIELNQADIATDIFAVIQNLPNHAPQVNEALTLLNLTLQEYGYTLEVYRETQPAGDMEIERPTLTGENA